MAIEKVQDELSATLEKNQDKIDSLESTKKEKEKGTPWYKKEFSIGRRVSGLDISLTMRHMSIMLRSGMSLSEALQVMAEQAHTPKLMEIFEKLHEDVMKGVTLTDSMSKFPKVFTKVMLSIIDVGEQGGTLEQNMLFLADFLKQNHDLGSKVKGALVYPAIVLSITFAEIIAIMFFVMPQIEELTAGVEEVPTLSRVVIDFARAFRANALYLGIITVVAIILVSYGLTTEKGKLIKDQLELRTPIFKNLKRYAILTNFSRTLAILLETGIPIVTALKITAETMDNLTYERIMRDVHYRVSEGSGLGVALEDYKLYFPGTYIKMIQVGEETGSLEGNLMYLHEFYAREVTEMSENLATLLEPIMMVMIGGIVGLLAVVVIGPIYQITGGVNDAAFE